MSGTAKLQIDDQTLELPIVTGSEGERGIDISKVRAQTGAITLDPAYGNTGSCESSVCFIDGEKGILRYRGYPIEQLAASSTFVETSYLLIWGKLPNADELAEWSGLLTEHASLHEGLRFAFNSIPPSGHPMATLSSMINAVSSYHPDLLHVETEDDFKAAAAKLIAKVRTIAAFSFRQTVGTPVRYPKPTLGYAENFLHMMFSRPYEGYRPDPDLARALDKIFILHAEHEQNCSTSTVRMVGSSGANLFASCAAGVCALWGPLHGGANVAVLKMLNEIRSGETTVKDFMEKVKRKEAKLMGFGHRVYKNFDPRATILKDASDAVLKKIGVQDPLLELAMEVEAIALADEYFISRKLYPNVDFYSGIIMQAMGIPVEMFTVMFSIGRMPGWVAHWYEQWKDPKARINRPRQIYQGANERDYVPIEKR